MVDNFYRSWKNFINESKKSLLLEFDREDQQAVMDNQENFTISYEVELQSADNMILAAQGDQESPAETRDSIFSKVMRTVNADLFLEDAYGEDSNYGDALIKFYYQNAGDEVDLEDHTINLQLVPFLFGAELSVMSSGTTKTVFMPLVQAFKNIDYVRAFLDAAFFQGSPLMEDEPEEWLEELIYNRAPELEPADTGDPQVRSILEEYAAGQMSREQENLLLHTVSSLMPMFFTRYFLMFGASNIDFSENPYHGFPLSTFFHVFNLGKEYYATYEAGWRKIQILFPGGVENEPMRKIGTVIKELTDRMSARMGGSDIGRFLDFYLEYLNDEVDNYIEMRMDQLGITPEQGAIDIHAVEADDVDRAYRAALAKYLPTFYPRWGDEIKVEQESFFDSGPGEGLEFSMKKYLNGIDEAFEFIDMFYKDFSNQEFFDMSEATGMHINIGYKGVGGDADGGGDFNLIKGYLFLNEKERARKGLSPHRTESHWAAALASGTKSELMADSMSLNAAGSVMFDPNYVRDISKEFAKSIEKGEISDIEGVYNDTLDRIAMSAGAKNIGFNINYARARERDESIKYIEFRYPGHDIDLKAVKDLTLYYSHIVMTMAEPDYKKDSYIQKFVGLLNKTAGAQIERTASFKKYFKPGMIIWVLPSLARRGNFNSKVHVQVPVLPGWSRLWYAEYKNRGTSFNLLWRWLKNTADQNFEPVPKWDVDDRSTAVPARIIDIEYDEDDLYVGSCTVEYYVVTGEGKIKKETSLFHITTIMESFSSKVNGINRYLGLTDEQRKEKGIRMVRNGNESELRLRKDWKKVTEFVESNKTIKYNPDYIDFDKMPAGAKKYYEFLVKKDIYSVETRGQEGERVDSVIDYGKKHPEQVKEYIRYGEIHSGEHWSKQFRRRFAPQYVGSRNNPAYSHLRMPQ